MNSHSDIARLHAILTNAIGISAKIFEGGVVVMFDPGQVVAFQRAALQFEGTRVRLRVWPAELQPQYKFVYSDGMKVEALSSLAERPGWAVKPNFHLAYWLSAPKMRWYPVKHLSGPTYMRQRIEDFHDHRAGRRPLERISDPSFRRWLLERSYAIERELPTLDEWAANLPRDHFDIRPGIEIARSWLLDFAAERDRAGAFQKDVRDGLNEVLTALGERQLPF